jgi:hypothetical protein
MRERITDHLALRDILREVGSAAGSVIKLTTDPPTQYRRT